MAFIHKTSNTLLQSKNNKYWMDINKYFSLSGKLHSAIFTKEKVNKIHI